MLFAMVKMLCRGYDIMPERRKKHIQLSLSGEWAIIKLFESHKVKGFSPNLIM